MSNNPKIFILDGLAVAELLSPGCKVDPYFLPEENSKNEGDIVQLRS